MRKVNCGVCKSENYDVECEYCDHCTAFVCGPCSARHFIEEAIKHENDESTIPTGSDKEGVGDKDCGLWTDFGKGNRAKAVVKREPTMPIGDPVFATEDDE